MTYCITQLAAGWSHRYQSLFLSLEADMHSVRLLVLTDEIGRTTSYAYDLASNLIATTDPIGATTTNIYSQCLLIATLNPLGYRTSYSYDRYQNRVTSQDALGNITTSIVDSNGYVIGTEDPLG